MLIPAPACFFPYAMHVCAGGIAVYPLHKGGSASVASLLGSATYAYEELPTFETLVAVEKVSALKHLEYAVGDLPTKANRFSHVVRGIAFA